MPDVVVIGGGVVGLSVAYHLAERGVREVVVLERQTCGSGATLKATGGVRHQFGTAINVQMSLLARPFWLAFDEALDTPIDFVQRGYLFLAVKPEQWSAATRNAVMQRSLGVPVQLLAPAEIGALTPALSLAGVLGGAYCPWDASLDVTAVMAGFLAGCRRRGVAVREGVAVTGVTLTGSRVTGVTTAAESLAAPVVVNAAGSWAAEVGRLAGLDLPVRPERRQAAITAPTAALAPSDPLIIDLGSGCYARPTGDGAAAIGGGDRGLAADRQDEQVDESDLNRMRALVGARFPGLAGVPLARAWVGLRPMSPDDHAILGATTVEGFLCACGLGAHGLMHAPAVGRLLAELIVDGAAHSLDIGPVSPARFARGELLSESVLF